MRAQTTLGIALLGLVACQSADSAKNGPSPAQRLHDDVAWLADDAREGRRAGTEEGLVAGRWLAERLRALGLEPAGDRGSYEQEFSVPLEPRSGGGSGLEVAAGVRVGEGAQSLAPLFCSEKGSVSGPVAYCGYGIELSARAWDDFAGRDLQGKIVVLVRGTPKSPPAAPAGSAEVPASPHGAPDRQAAAPDPHAAPKSAGPGAAPANPPANPHATAASDTPARAHGDMQLVAAGDPFVNAGLVFIKVMNAKRRGAAAVVLLQHPSDTGQPVLAFHEGGSGRAGIPCIALAWKDAQRVFGPGLAEWTRDLESKPARADQVDSRAFTLSADVERGHGSAVNVLGIVPGQDRTRTVVLGAHYDHLGYGGTGSLAPGVRAIHNGADDNASGTAAVLEIARELRAGSKPACDVLVALWSGEELGLLGSEWWAEHPTVPFARVVGNVNLDMVGRAGGGKLQVLGAGSAAEFPSWLAQAGPAAELELSVNASASAMAGSSDHATFAKRKKPVLHLFSGLHTDYHKPTDDTERFEAEGAARVVELAEDLVRRMTAAPGLAFVEPPPAPEGEKRVASGFNAWFGSIPNYAFEGPGVKIDGTSSGSPAERAGFLAGDVLLTIGEVKVANVYDLTYALQYYKPGDVVLVAFERDGKRDETRVTLSSRGVR
ncbi:MAG: M28 family peptidase [Planctomycetota bacterium]|nr:M28 family peptidase [Planctomycetota bacterium]